MKILFVLFTLLNVTLVVSQDYEIQKITKFQEELMEEYNNEETSPLSFEDKKYFRGIEFFPINKNLIINAGFKKSKKKQIIPFETSSNKTKNYKIYGQIFFTYKSKQYTLNVYQSDPINPDYPNHLFLPFYDATNGITTYGGGRYLDFNTLDFKQKKIVLNFNLAYNPYCAYSLNYSCPIPPVENELQFEVNAGVMYHSKH